MDDVKIRVLSGFRGSRTVVHAYDDTLSPERDEFRTIPQHLLILCTRLICCRRLHLAQLIPQFVAFMFRLEQPIRNLLDALLGETPLPILGRAELHGNHKSDQYADECNEPPALPELFHLFPLCRFIREFDERRIVAEVHVLDRMARCFLIL